MPSGDENTDDVAVTLQGVDISHFNGAIDWGAVKRSGRAFAVAAIGDGLYQDPTFAGHWSAIRAAGLVRGAYQYFRAAVDPAAQANIAVGRAHMNQRVRLLIADAEVHVIDDNGVLLRQLTLDPTRDYQPMGRIYTVHDVLRQVSGMS